jgi:dihydropteroate synthase
MGIVNVTPDSFSDGGKFLNSAAAVEHGLKLVAEGADILDIGGESTRPGAQPVSVEDEIKRVIPVVEQLAQRTPTPISVDTMKPEVARAAVEAGAVIINDVASGNNLEMARLVAGTGAGYVLMHMKGVPRNMQQNPEYGDVVAEVDAFFKQGLAFLKDSGVHLDQVVLDTGIGFGKRLEHNLKLLAAQGQFNNWGRPILLGVSRKSFMGELLGVAVEDRLAPSLACACWAAQHGVQIIRTHDVAATRQALRMTEALMDRS